VARDLLGMRLVRCLDGRRLSGIILETEAYQARKTWPATPAPGARRARR
jgi:3-methyladenine DNA glycosylase Mpg